MLTDIETYINRFTISLISNYENTSMLYEGKDGALRLARELAYGLKDFEVKCQDDVVLNSYMDVCCRFYQLNQPIKLNEWASEICRSLTK